MSYQKVLINSLQKLSPINKVSIITEISSNTDFLISGVWPITQRKKMYEIIYM